MKAIDTKIKNEKTKKVGSCGHYPRQVQADKKSKRTRQKPENSDFLEHSQNFPTAVRPDITFLFFWKHDFVAAINPKCNFLKTKHCNLLISACSTDTKLINFTKNKNACNGFLL